ncbi:Peroxyredoxin [Ectocarpus siliculosus]|uniref:Peroxyredoxin n=1 Tax=Ectocarpus siliculosus TaxID=2880 RepID=D8LG20_ECTSI|nr:Peroxyredoxin [Ectocarpus siliculosus]|eukprot:CBN78919.1 Peroxyredoxin [Ectocarpus siliculosus]
MKMSVLARAVGGCVALRSAQGFVASSAVGRTTGVRSIHQASRLAMAIKEGDKFPMDSTFQIKGDAGPADVPASEIFAGKKVVICGVPGAFTPTCDDNHLPSFIANADKFKEKGVDTVACMSVNDAFVMSRWIKSLDAEDKVTMLADGGAVFAEESGLCVKTGKFGGTRLQRLAMIVNDGTIEKLFLEDGTGYTDVSSGDTVLAAL